MDLKPGYMQTEVGVIPNDWAISTLEAVVTKFQNGYAFPSDGYVDSGVPIITMAQIGLSGLFQFDEESVNYWPLGKVNALKDFVVVNGDIIVAMTDVTPQKNLIGRMACVDRSGPFLLNQRVGLLKLDKQKIDSRFIRALSNSSFWRSYSRGVATLGVQANIGTKELKSGKIPLPPIVEQRIIATALSDVDALLDSLDRLIAKKRDLKQAAMQQLLTGQTRLPGFSGEWEEKQLDEIADVFKGSSLSKSSITPTGLYPCILYGELFTSYRRVINKIFSRTNLREGLLSIAGDVLLPASTTTTGADLATASALLIDDVALGGDILVIRKKGEKYDSVFLASYLSHTTKHQIAELTQGITIHHLYGKSLKTLLLHIPSLPEQTAIATALNEMDTELFALEQRRNKTAALKQGMMQELLTGRTRLV